MLHQIIKKEIQKLNSNLIQIHSDLAHGFTPKEFISRNQILESHLNALKNLNADIWMPTFNYNFCEEKIYNIETTKSTTGILTEYFRTLDETWRTPIPVFSFAGTGNRPDLSIKENVNPFGGSSAFAYLYNQQATLMHYGSNFDVTTILHFAETISNNLLYRYDKHFKGKVITETGESEILLKFHVRPMGKHLDYDWVKIEDELYKVGILKKFTDDKAIILLCPIYELVNFWIEKIKENPLYFLDKESIKWVAPMLDSLGRPFLISDFE